MLCAIYRSSKKEQTYLYIETKDDFSKVPEELMRTFGEPKFVMYLRLDGGKKLAAADIKQVIRLLSEQGFYLQVPPPVENLLKQHQTLTR